MKIIKIIAVFWAIFMLHTTAQAAQNISFAVQIPNAQWWKAIERGDQNLPRQLNLGLSAEILMQLAIVHKRIQAQTNKNFTIGLTASNEINAFAKKQQGYDLIILTSGFLLRFGNNPDVLATTLGHELAHHYLGHTEHEENHNMFAGNSLTPSAKPLYSLANNNISNSFNPGEGANASSFDAIRNQERAADLLGMYWATQAGYSANGVYKLAQGLKELQGSDVYLPTHPSNAERMQVAQTFAQYSSNSDECTASFKFETAPIIQATPTPLVELAQTDSEEFENFEIY